MADRAVGKGDPGVPREVFELDKDERWQARLDEARARREIALREKAAGKPQSKRPKPWEVEGQEAPKPIEPVVQERGDDKFDFADRLEQLREGDASGKAKKETPSKPEPAEITRATPRASAKTERRFSRPPAGEAIERMELPAEKTQGKPELAAPSEEISKRDASDTTSDRKPTRLPVEDALEKLSAASARIATKPIRPSGGETGERRRPPFAKPDDGTDKAGPRRRSARVPSLVVPEAPDVADIAARYAETLRPEPDPVTFPFPETEPTETPLAAPAAEAMAEAEAEPRKGAWHVRLPHLSTRPGVRPLGMAIGLLALSALPLTTEAPPLEKGPSMPVIAPFAAPPALGVTWSLYARPVEMRAYGWRRDALPAALATPEFDPPAALLGGIASPVQPLAAEAGGALPVASDTPLPEPARMPGLDLPEASATPPAVETAPPADEAMSLPDTRPVPPREREEPPEPQQDVQAEPAVPAPETPLRITILTPPRADKLAAEELAADIPARGHELVRVRSVDHPISQRNLRYFHEGDRTEAARLARAYDAELRDFTWFRPQPLPGTAELWLSGGASGADRPEASAPTLRDRIEDLPFVVIRPANPSPEPPRSGNILNRVMEGVGNALGTGLGLPPRDN